ALADVIVVNHHLFFADLALRSSSAGDAGAAVLPDYDAVIFDEAHAVEEVATEHFGAQLSSHRVSELARDALNVIPPGRVGRRDLAARRLREGRDFFDAAAASATDAQRWVLKAGSLEGAEKERLALADLANSLAAALTGGESEELSLIERRCLAL